MVSLVDDFDSESSRSSNLAETNFSREPQMLAFFTGDADEVMTHFLDEASVRGYVQCLGKGCPLCLLGNKPTRHFLLPVYNLERGRVEILKGTWEFGPGTLLSLIKAHLGAGATDKTFLVVKRENYKYSSRTMDFADGVDRGVEAIKDYSRGTKEGIGPKSIIRQVSKDELQAIPRIRFKLSALGFLTDDSAGSDLCEPF